MTGDAPDADRGFEAQWRRDPDPWDYASSPYEAAKYDRTLEACGPAPIGRALELAGANGVFTGRLAERCAAVESLELSPTAVRLARERLRGLGQVAVRHGSIPEDLPDGPRFDLVVASEILYYLDDVPFRRTLAALPALLVPGGRLVAVHWTGTAPDLRRSARETHAALLAVPGLRPLPGGPTEDGAHGYLLATLTTA